MLNTVAINLRTPLYEKIKQLTPHTSRLILTSSFHSRSTTSTPDLHRPHLSSECIFFRLNTCTNCSDKLLSLLLVSNFLCTDHKCIRTQKCSKLIHNLVIKSSSRGSSSRTLTHVLICSLIGHNA